MRSSVTSSLKSFGLGLAYAVVGCSGLVAAAFLWSPPGADWALPVNLSAADSTVAMPPVAATRSEMQVASTAPRIDDNGAKRELTRMIQRELARVGCYSGAADGNWSDDTRGAMAAFNGSVRVELPVTGPDYILLTLLQGHGARACGDANAPVLARSFANPGVKRAAATPQAQPNRSQQQQPKEWATVT